MGKDSNVPELRFPGFEGEWEEKKLGELTTWSSGGTPSKDNPAYWNGDIPWISASSMHGFEYSESELHISHAGLRNGSRLAEKGSILILVRGSMLFKRIPVGIAIRDVSFNQDVKCIKVNELSSSQFILYWFFAHEVELLNMVTGTGIGAGKLELSELRALELRFPSLAEQTKIADFLSAVDEKVQALKKKKALLDTYKKGLMQKLFSQALRFRDVDGSDFPDWEEKRLGEVGEFSKGKGISKADIASDGKTPCIRYGELYTTYGEVIDQVVSKTNMDPKDLIFSEGNDVIIPSSGETPIDIATASCVLRSGIALGGDLNIIRTRMNGVFLSFYLNNEKRGEIAGLAQGATVVHLYSSKLAILKLDVPSLAEQTKIADFFTVLDGKIQGVSREIGQVEMWKRGLLQRLIV